MLELNKIYQTDCLSGLKLLPDNSVDCCVTSPPYFNQRNYGTAEWIGGDENCKHESIKYRIGNNELKNKKETFEGCVAFKNKCTDCGAEKEDKQIGLETTLQEYIDNLVEIFEEVRRVLKPTGQLWLNIGDSYAGSGKGRNPDGSTHASALSAKQGTNGSVIGNIKGGTIQKGFKGKDLMMIPARLAIALQESGWYLRNDIIWAKATSGVERNGSCMPEPVKDRFVSAHEHIFLLTKKDKYFFDSFAVKEPLNVLVTSKSKFGDNKYSDGRADNGRLYDVEKLDGLANMRNVWRINLQPGSSGEHIAGYPEKLVEPCVKAGTSEYGCCKDCGKPYERVLEKNGTIKMGWKPEGRDMDRYENIYDRRENPGGMVTGNINQYKSSGWQKTCKCETDETIPSIVLDPFMGSGTTAFVSLKLSRKFIGFELNEKYIKFANERMRTMKSYSNNDAF